MNSCVSRRTASAFIPHPSSLSLACRSCLATVYRLLHHVFINGDDAGAAVDGIELQIANHAPERFAQGAGAEALLLRRVPGDGDQRATGDLQVDAEALEVGARGAEDRSV